MTIERLLEAVMRLARASGKPLYNVKIEVDDMHYAVAVTNPRNTKVKDTRQRTSRIKVSGPGIAWMSIGEADIDLNDMVLSIKFKDDAPWWLVRPFQDALEGK